MLKFLGISSNVLSVLSRARRRHADGDAAPDEASEKPIFFYCEASEIILLGSALCITARNGAAMRMTYLFIHQGVSDEKAIYGRH